MFQISQRYSDGDLVEKLREGNVFFYEFKSDWKGACWRGGSVSPTDWLWTTSSTFSTFFFSIETLERLWAAGSEVRPLRVPLTPPSSSSSSSSSSFYSYLWLSHHNSAPFPDTWTHTLTSTISTRALFYLSSHSFLFFSLYSFIRLFFWPFGLQSHQEDSSWYYGPYLSPSKTHCDDDRDALLLYAAGKRN